MKEDYPSERYDTFIEYFGDKQVAEYYMNLIALISTNDEAIAALIQESKGLQLSLAFEGDQNVLKSINAVIERLNKIHSTTTKSVMRNSHYT